MQGQQADLRAGGPRHHRLRRGQRGVTLDQAVDYWISIKSALAGQEDYVIINIGNEPYGNTNASAWTAATTNAIQRHARDAGFEQP